MRIIFSATRYVSPKKATGGFPAYLYRVSQALIRMGHHPIIVALGEKQAHFFEDEIEVYLVPKSVVAVENEIIQVVLSDFLESYCLCKKIKEICKKEKVDLIQFTSLAATSLCYYGKIPAVMRLSSYTKTYFSTHQTYSKAKEAALSLLERLAAGRCNAVFAPCEITARAFSKDIKRKVYVLETPFFNDVRSYDYSIYQKELVNKKYVLFFGQMYAEKGIWVIAEALYDFLKINKEHYVVFCGEMVQKEKRNVKKEMCKYAGEYADRIIFLSPLPHEQLYPIIQKADFVILPSIMDNFSNACIEAMYFKRVVIGTEGASFEQLITHEKSGLLCKRNDAKDLLRKMNQAAKLSAKKKDEIGERAHLRILKLHPMHTVKILLDFYTYVINHK